MSETFDKIMERPKFWDKYSMSKALDYNKAQRLDNLFNINETYGSNHFRLILTLDGDEVLNKKVLLNTSLDKYYTSIEESYFKDGYTIQWEPRYIRMIMGGVNSVGTYIAKKQYTITFKVDGEVYSSLTLYENTEITRNLLPTEPTKQYYTFDEWENLPETLIEDVTVNATFIPNPPDVFIFKLTREQVGETGYNLADDLSNVNIDTINTLFNDSSISVTSYTYAEASLQKIPFTMGDGEVAYAMTKASLTQPFFYDSMGGHADYNNNSTNSSITDITGYYQTNYKLINLTNVSGNYYLKF